MADEEMEIEFLNMGQGDCILISCPDDEVIVVDCGSTKGTSVPIDNNGEPSTSGSTIVQRAQKRLRSYLTTAGKTKVHSLIITHPDTDHYNQVPYVFGNAVPKVEINKIYFSMAEHNPKKSSPLVKYRGLGQNMKLLGNPVLREVTLNNKASEYREWTHPYKPAVTPAPTKLTAVPAEIEVIKGHVMSLGGTAIDWSIKIIAGNIQAVKNTCDRVNAASLVTLIQFGGQRCLLMGDATEDTQDYLYNKYSKILALPLTNVSVYQVPHHGSDGCMAKPAFRNMIDPEHVVISVGQKVTSFKLPRFSVTDDWLKCGRLATRVPGVPYDCWKTSTETSPIYPLNKLDSFITDWQNKPLTVNNNTSRTFFYLDDPTKHFSTPGADFYGFVHTSSGAKGTAFLYRNIAGKDLRETSIGQTVIKHTFS